MSHFKPNRNSFTSISSFTGFTSNYSGISKFVTIIKKEWINYFSQEFRIISAINFRHKLSWEPSWYICSGHPQLDEPQLVLIKLGKNLTLAAVQGLKEQDGAQSNSRQASNYTENSDGEQMGIRKEKTRAGARPKSWLSCEKFFFGTFPRIFWWDESFEEGTGGVVRRQTPAIIVTECSGVCNFLGHEGKPKESTFRFGLRFKLPKEANAPWERGSGDGGFWKLFCEN